MLLCLVQNVLCVVQRTKDKIHRVPCAPLAVLTKQGLLVPSHSRGLNPLPVTLIGRKSVGYSNVVGRCCTSSSFAFLSKITFEKICILRQVFFCK